MRYRALSPGDCMPQAEFHCADGSRFQTSSLGGDYLLLYFVAPDMHGILTSLPGILRQAVAQRDPANARLVVVHPSAPCPLQPTDTPAARDAFDPGMTVFQKFGAAPLGATEHTGVHALAVLFDPMQRLIASKLIRSEQDGQSILSVLDAQPPLERFSGRRLHAPVLYLPRVFSPELCAALIQRYHAQHCELTGVMRVIGGITIGVRDPSFKRRRDCLIEDMALKRRIQLRIRSAVLPQLRKAFGFDATRMERYLVGCYSAHDAGHFAPHRDNTTPATAHRRFAISVNLNEDFDGGAVYFPEYGPEGIKAESGAAVVFGCGMLHAVGQVTRGARYAFLPFIYDEAAARIRHGTPDTQCPAHEKTAPHSGAV